MPNLWSNIVTDLTEDYPPAPLFQLIARLSDPALINVDLWGAGDLHKGYPLVDPRINPGLVYTTLVDSLKILSVHIHRCKRFRVFITDARSAKSFIGIGFESAKVLEELELATQCGQDVDNEIFDGLFGLIHLRRLKLIGFGFGLGAWASESNGTIQRALPIISWSKLLHLDLSYPISTEEVFQLLQRCTSAISIRIRAKMLFGYNGPVISVPNVRALRLSACGRSIHRSLKKIQAPKLEVIYLETRREMSVHEALSFEIPSEDDNQLDWASVLNQSLSVRIMILNDPMATCLEAVRLAEDDYVKRIPVVKLGIRRVETWYVKNMAPWLMKLGGDIIGWSDSSVVSGYRGLLSDIGVEL